MNAGGDHRTAAIVVTYRRKVLLRQCIQAILQQTVPCDVLIVDNHSGDGTRQIVEEIEDSRISYQDTGSNLGGAGGFNYGLRWALKGEYDFVWLMDDDTIPTPTSLEELLKASERLKGEYGFLSSGVLWKDGMDCEMNRQRASDRYCGNIPLLQEGIVRIEQATFVSMFCKVGTVHKAGLPIREFFIWGDDIEYSRRLACRLGLPCYLVSRSTVVHAMEYNTGSNLAIATKERIDRYLYAYRNECFIYRKEGYKAVFQWLIRCGVCFAAIFRSSDYKLKRWRVMIRGICLGVFFSPKIEFPMPEKE